MGGKKNYDTAIYIYIYIYILMVLNLVSFLCGFISCWFEFRD